MYSGATIEAIPKAIPPRMRYTISAVKDPEKAQPIEEIMNNNPEAININFRPYLSLKYPETNTPETAPSKAQLTNQPTPELERLNCNFICSMVPEITAVSKPNRNPAKAAVKATNNSLDFMIF